MLHFCVTLTSEMAKIRYVYQKGNRWWYYRRHPVALVRAGAYSRPHVDESLHTSDVREAESLARFKSMKLEEEWEQKKRDLGLSSQKEFERRSKSGQRDRPLSSLSEEQKELFLHNVFLSLERNSFESGLRDTDSLSESKREEAAETLKDDLASFTGTKNIAPIDWEAVLTKELNEAGITIDSKALPIAPEFLLLFKAAYIENTVRSFQCLGLDSGTPPPILDIPRANFREVGIGGTPVAPLDRELAKEQPLTLGQLAESYTANQLASGLRPKTIDATKRHVSIMLEAWGVGTKVSDLSREHGVQLVEFLKAMPINGKVRYPGMLFSEMTKIEAKLDKPRWLSPKTISFHFNGISAILSFAEEEGWIARNPLSNRNIRKQLPKVRKKSKADAMMTSQDISKVFFHEKYLAERDLDPRGNARFWVPLLCLFHGMRSGEAAQLLVSDIHEEKGVAYMMVKVFDEDDEEVKALKTEASVRKTPVHEEMIKMGFLKFVASQKSAGEEWLFPALETNSQGSRVDGLGKWFIRHRGKILNVPKGRKRYKTLHNFRDLFEQKLRNVKTEDSTRYFLCGWSQFKPKNSSIDYADGYPIEALKEVLDKVKFPGVDFSPLYEDSGA